MGLFKPEAVLLQTSSGLRKVRNFTSLFSSWSDTRQTTREERCSERKYKACFSVEIQVCSSGHGKTFVNPNKFQPETEQDRRCLLMEAGGWGRGKGGEWYFVGKQHCQKSLQPCYPLGWCDVVKPVFWWQPERFKWCFYSFLSLKVSNWKDNVS